MVTVVRILFGVAAAVFFFLGSLFLGREITALMKHPPKIRVIAIAYTLNTVLLAVFLTLWCVERGII